MQPVLRLRAGADVLAVTDDAWTRELIPPTWSGPAWSLPGAAAYGSGPAGEPAATVTVVGAPAAAAALGAAVLADLPEAPYVLTVPRGAVPLPEGEAQEWELMTTRTAPPPQPREEDVVPLAPGPELADLLNAASPGHSVRPGAPEVHLWAGLRAGDGGLASVGALLLREGTGAPHIASVATAPAHRGQGLAAAVTAWLTRRALEGGAPWCSLAHLSTEQTAHRVYERLGYRTVQEFTSVTLDAW
ncbi:GNAT family N-acetyltransferase [Streptomyces racemochromogenes]|uniref:GNAT family N-acetyltransferase n=1 Tax=Streptomyces racemochromogenes TaxID=67353 RepID=A0ABW7PIC4_9ACTN